MPYQWVHLPDPIPARWMIYSIMVAKWGHRLIFVIRCHKSRVYPRFRLWRPLQLSGGERPPLS